MSGSFMYAWKGHVAREEVVRYRTENLYVCRPSRRVVSETGTLHCLS